MLLLRKYFYTHITKEVGFCLQESNKAKAKDWISKPQPGES